MRTRHSRRIFVSQVDPVAVFLLWRPQRCREIFAQRQNRPCLEQILARRQDLDSGQRPILGPGPLVASRAVDHFGRASVAFQYQRQTSFHLGWQKIRLGCLGLRAGCGGRDRRSPLGARGTISSSHPIPEDKLNRRMAQDKEAYAALAAIARRGLNRCLTLKSVSDAEVRDRWRATALGRKSKMSRSHREVHTFRSRSPL